MNKSTANRSNKKMGRPEGRPALKDMNQYRFRVIK